LKLILKQACLPARQVQNDKKKVRDYETTLSVIPAAGPESTKPIGF
jgi:hypothetical protein